MQRIATGSAGQAHDSEMEISRKEAFHRAVSGRLPEGVERIFSWNDSSRGNSVTGWYSDILGKSVILDKAGRGLGALKSLEGGQYAEAAERFRKRTEAFIEWAGKKESLAGLSDSGRRAVEDVLRYVRDDSFSLAAVDRDLVMFGGDEAPKPKPAPVPPKPEPAPAPQPKPEPKPEPKPAPVPPVKPKGCGGCLWKLLAALLLLLLLLALGSRTISGLT